MTKGAINKTIIPISIASFLLLISIVKNYTMGIKIYYGIAFISIGLLLYFINKKFYNYVFLLTLILGCFNIIEIFYLNIALNIGPISFNVVFIALAVITFIVDDDFFQLLFPEENK